MGASPTSKCRQEFRAKIKSHNPLIVVSRGLTQHLRSKNFKNCLKVYHENDLVSLTTGSINMTTSLRKPQTNVGSNGPTFTPAQIGLTTATAPNSAARNSATTNFHASINQQVNYNAYQPFIPHPIITSLLSTHLDSDSDKDDDDDSDGVDNYNNPDNNNDDLPAYNHRSIKPIIKLQEATPLLSAEIELMMILKRHKMPLNSFKELFNWAINAQSRTHFDFSQVLNGRSRGRDSVLKDIHSRINLPLDTFEARAVEWLPDKVPTTLYIRPFFNALTSLLSNSNLTKEGNLSFPDPTTPYSPVSLNTASDDMDTIISELHHGEWWSNTWKSRCDTGEGSIEILVPIILYMDGISLDARNRLQLTPLNMTLGIFNSETRKRADAWETIYFHPDGEHLSANHVNKAEGIDNIINLHTGLRAALESFQELCNNPNGVTWDYLPYNNKLFQVSMRFAISFVIGDTELHDKLCGRYGSRSKGVAQLCRHCFCPQSLSVNPREAPIQHLRRPSDLAPHHTEAHFKSNSHHNIKNVFHELDLGENPQNIHLATPGECLHMHQLGSAKRAVESFSDFVKSLPPNPTINRTKLLRSIGKLAQQLGGLLSRQSDRDFPRTKFTSHILTTTKKEGSDYAGILLCLIIAMASSNGRKQLMDSGLSAASIDSIVATFELIIAMEEFLKHGQITKGELENFPKMAVHYINQINKNCKRKDGSGTCTIKNHLYLHIHKYIQMWGPPTGWDSAASESHHKTEIKAPSRNTQRNASTFIPQTACRQLENRAIERACFMFNLHQQEQSTLSKDSTGAKFTIQLNNKGEPSMNWQEKGNRNKIAHPPEIIKYCCEVILPQLTSNYVEGMTEHHRRNTDNNIKYIFRSHPSYRLNSGQKNGVWYDWAMFDHEESGEYEDGIPAQILCLLNISTWVDERKSNGVYAVVRKFLTRTVAANNNPRTKSSIVSHGILEPNFCLLECETIVDVAAVVPNPSESNNKFLVIKNREFWLHSFYQQLKAIRSKTLPELYDEG